jgi:hypothetical protein
VKSKWMIRRQKLQKKRKQKVEGFRLIMVAVWHCLPSAVTFLILLRRNTKNKKRGNKDAHPSHSPKCAFVCVRACVCVRVCILPLFVFEEAVVD